jgi:hypothetical protein
LVLLIQIIGYDVGFVSKDYKLQWKIEESLEGEQILLQGYATSRTQELGSQHMDEHLLRRLEAQRISRAKEDDTAQEICLERECEANAKRRSIDNVNRSAHLNARWEAFARRIFGENDAAREARLSIRHKRDWRSRVAENAIGEAGSAMRYEVHATRRSNMRLENLQPHYLGRMDKVCTYCGALHWSVERLSISSELNPQFGSYCLKRRVYLPPMQDPPQRLRQLLEGDFEQAKEFWENIRRYNVAFAFTSIGVSRTNAHVEGRGPYVFKFQREMRHLTGSMLPNPRGTARYAQLYFIDTAEATNIRMQRNPQCMQTTMVELHKLLRNHHAFFGHYQQAYEILSELERQ